MNDPAILMGLGYSLLCAATLCLIAWFAMPVSQGRAIQAVEHLPEDYRFLALREMDVTRHAGVIVTRRKMRFIVRCIERLAREHGGIA